MKDSKYRQCQECRHRFPLQRVVRKQLKTYEQLGLKVHYTIECPRCNSENIAIINKLQYYQR